ncbi:hypothetical protein AMECASPLE_036624 [Ameca splendens]|uniref:Uncharacterized protein n=1 Tax=Ameca splendens TaxID=208324 RepID=A0ABV0ZGF7_9TELE
MLCQGLHVPEHPHSVRRMGVKTQWSKHCSMSSSHVKGFNPVLMLNLKGSFYDLCSCYFFHSVTARLQQVQCVRKLEMKPLFKVLMFYSPALYQRVLNMDKQHDGFKGLPGKMD